MVFLGRLHMVTSKLENRTANAGGTARAVAPPDPGRASAGRLTMAPRPPRRCGGGGIGGLLSALRQMIQMSTANNRNDSAAARSSVLRGAYASIAVNAPSCLWGPTQSSTLGVSPGPPATSALPAVAPAEPPGSKGEASHGSGIAPNTTAEVSVFAAPAPRKTAGSAPIDIPCRSHHPPGYRPRLNDEGLWLYNPVAAWRAGPEEIGGYPLMFQMDDVD